MDVHARRQFRPGHIVLWRVERREHNLMTCSRAEERHDEARPFRMLGARMSGLGLLRLLFGREDVSAQGVLHQDAACAPTQSVERRNNNGVDRRRSRQKKIAGLISIGVLSIFACGFIVGVAPPLGMKATDSTDFCISCHTMTHLWEATKRSTHYQNEKGVQVGCPDCHVPHRVGDYLLVKMAALHDVYSEIVNPALTKEDYENRRPRLVQKVREAYLANDSAECRSCHVFENFTRTIKAHNRAKNTGMTCIKCHYNLVHGEVPWPEVEAENTKQESPAYAATGPLQGVGIGVRPAYGAEGKNEKK